MKWSGNHNYRKWDSCDHVKWIPEKGQTHTYTLGAARYSIGCVTGFERFTKWFFPSDVNDHLPGRVDYLSDRRLYIGGEMEVDLKCGSIYRGEFKKNT